MPVTMHPVRAMHCNRALFMSRPPSAARTRNRTLRPCRFPRPLPRIQSRTFRALRAAPLVLQLIVGLIVSAGLCASANLVYHAVHKPTELLFPVSGMLAKTPPETWRVYGPDFRKYATAVIGACTAQISGVASRSVPSGLIANSYPAEPRSRRSRSAGPRASG